MNNKQANVRVIAGDEIVPMLPVVLPWDEKIDREIDIFVTALGFEDRATAIPQAVAMTLSSARLKRPAYGLICRYRTNSGDNDKNLPLIRTALAAFCDTQGYVDADSPQEVASTLSSLIENKVEVGRSVEIVFDISASSGNLILSVLHTVFSSSVPISLRILYSEPQKYFPTQADYELNPEALVLTACDQGNCDSYQEYGVSDVDVNELYPGIDGESRPEFVIAVPAFRTSRLGRCLQHLTDQPLAAPDKYVYWILSEPPASELKWRLDLQKRIVKTTLSSMVGFLPTDPLAPQLAADNHATCSTRDYRDIFQRVLEEADSHLGYNISIVHMGSKLQAFGIALALHARKEISVCYAKPIQYNPTRYSEGIGPMWQLDIPDLALVLNQVQTIGELTFTTKIETVRTGLPTI